MSAPWRFQFGLRSWFYLTFLLGIGMMLLFAVSGTRASAARISCSNNLKQIGLALQNYHDTYHVFPPAHCTDANGAPNHSWRMLIIPFAFQHFFYDMYHWNDRWDSRSNLDLFTKPVPVPPSHYGPPGSMMIVGHPDLYRCPSRSRSDTAWTDYVLITGPGTAFPDNQCVSLNEIKDGIANTIIAVEIDKSQIHWLSPVDLDVRTMSMQINDPKRQSISSRHPDGALVLFADGTTKFLSSRTDPKTLRALITIDGGEDVDREQLVACGLLRTPKDDGEFHELRCDHDVKLEASRGGHGARPIIEARRQASIVARMR